MAANTVIGKYDYGIVKAFYLSDRLHEALSILKYTRGLQPVDVLREGMWELLAHPERMKIEEVGVEERLLAYKLHYMSQPDVDTLEHLASRHGINSRSMIVRNAIEALVDKYEVQECKKQDFWQSRPLNPREGAKGVNCTPKLPENYKVKCLAIPGPIWACVQNLIWRKDSKGKPKKTLSDFIRETIDAFPPGMAIAPLDKKDLVSNRRNVTFNLLESQQQKLQLLLMRNPQFRTDNQLILALLKETIH